MDDQQRAVERFRQLSPLEPYELEGLWMGRGIPTGHPFDGVLENLGWFGKRFNSDLRADALLFRAGGRRLRAIDPKWVPLNLALRFHKFGRTRLARTLFSWVQRGFQAKGPVASLETLTFEGAASAALIYDDQPIIDHFRRIDQNAIMGLMAIRNDDRLFAFELQRMT
ncbi:DUF4334 domain-containing protein [Sinorhizobium sp. Sb3]|uniref:DUF4334 domain-containing protein n=1 Tax=Sinorhizobium/Ensifer group TaxID=227292 RepID=UPI001FD9C47E|nr:DUF4334 domain-containing protein [Sinorhizobium sp. Sb3]